MRKTFGPVSDTRTTDSLELTRRLLKGVTDIGKRLDEQRSRALTILNIFTPSGETLRGKLRDYCERLIFKDPTLHVGKTEELLWRKGFYDVVFTAKKLKKANVWNDKEKALLSIHLSVGVGFYHHLILKLQSAFGFDLVGIIDFAFVKSDTLYSNPKHNAGQSQSHTKEVTQCVMRLIHRSLVCLGDLARYRLDLDPNWDPLIAERYYKMAIAIDPNIGMPHNQLGTMAGNRNYGLDAVHHYMRCVLCSEPFEGAEGNLKRIIVNYSICSDDNNIVQHCISKLFALLQLWDYNMPNSDRINQECQDLLNDIENCLSMEQTESDKSIDIENETSIEAYLQSCKQEKVMFLTDDMIFKIVTICLMSISRLRMKESSEAQGVIAVTLAILSQLIQFTISRLQDSIVNIPLSKEIESTNGQGDVQKDKKVQNGAMEEGGTNVIANGEQNGKIHEKKNSQKPRDKGKSSLLTKLRRPRKRGDSSDSDASDNDGATMATSSDEMNSDISETEDISENMLSEDDGLSDDISDDEETCTKSKNDEKTTNGHTKVNTDENSTNNLTNGEKPLDADNQSKSTINAENTTNSTENETADDIIHIAQSKKQLLNSQDVLNIVMEKELLCAIKVCCDWLRSNKDIIKICARSSRILLQRIVILLNLINVNTDALLKDWNNDSAVYIHMNKLKDFVKSVPLPEDIDLKGLNLLEDAHKSLDWNIIHKVKINKCDITLLRILKLIDFGCYLGTIGDTGVKYDESLKLFKITESKKHHPPSTKNNGTVVVDANDSETEHPRGKLMRHMGKLWLKAEVRALENRVRSKLISPYLVPDHEALTKHMPILKRLVYAKKFVIVIPTVVVSALDEIKRTSGKAREATRWLEAQLRRGSRFLRAQRPHERLAIPFIKGPRPKDKEAWLFFQIIECCYYFTQQSKVGLNDSEAPVVTLLTGCNPQDRKASTFSPDGLAKNAGVNLDYIESFHTKWKTSSKSHG